MAYYAVSQPSCVSPFFFYTRVGDGDSMVHVAILKVISSLEDFEMVGWGGKYFINENFCMATVVLKYGMNETVSHILNYSTLNF